LCSNATVTEELLSSLVDSYEACRALEPFVRTNGAIALAGSRQQAETALNTKKLEFVLAIQRLLPMNVDGESLLEVLGEAVSLIDQSEINSALLQAAGLHSAALPQRAPLAVELSTTSTVAAPSEPVKAGRNKRSAPRHGIRIH
jgi:hypothetical protein